MTIEELGPAIHRIANRWNFKVDETGALHTWRVDVAIKQTDGQFLFQYVYIWFTKDHTGKERVYMNSPCGSLISGLPLEEILREALWCNYSAIGITKMKRADEGVEDEVVVQCVPLLLSTTESLLEEMIYEVAVNAQVVRQRFFSSLHQ